MAINSNTPNLESIVDDLITTDTTEATFRTAIDQVVIQVDANEIELNTARTLAFDGSVLATAKAFNLKDANKDIVVTTTLNTGIISNAQLTNAAVQIENMAANSVGTTNIVNNAITTAKIRAGQINGTHVTTTATRKLIISNSDAVEIFSMYGFRTLT